MDILQLTFFSLQIHFILLSKYVSSFKLQKESHYHTKLEDIVWRNVVIMVFLHLSTFYGLYLILTLQFKLTTFVVCKFGARRNILNGFEYLTKANVRIYFQIINKFQGTSMGCLAGWVSQLVHIVCGPIVRIKRIINCVYFWPWPT